MSVAGQQLRSIMAELKENTRLRVGVWLITFIAFGQLLLVQSDRNALAYDDYLGELQRLRKAEALGNEERWPELLDAEETRRAALTSSLWEAETTGLAQASLQATLGDRVAGLDVRNVRIRSGVSEPVPDLPGVWQIQAQLEASYQRGAELQFLYALAISPKKLFVDRLDLSPQNARMLVLVSAYFVGIGPKE